MVRKMWLNGPCGAEQVAGSLTVTLTIAGELDFVDVLLLQPYKKTAIRIATVASVQNDAPRDMVKTSGKLVGRQQVESPGQTRPTASNQFSCLSSTYIRILFYYNHL